MKNRAFTHVRIFLLLMLLGFTITKQANAQIEMQAFVGKAHSDASKMPALRFGVGLNNILWDRVGLYYTYEFRRPDMPFETSTYSGNYTRDILGGIVKINPVLSVYGGLGLSQKGITDNLTFQGLRNEVGLQFSTNNILYNINVFAQVGYSFSMRLTTNFGVKIPLTYEKRTLSEVLYGY